jgi:Saxitoxin biosynthesis operon protein SxtJ
MQWADIPRNPTIRTLRQFAALLAAVFGWMALWQWYRHGNGVAAAVCLVVSLVGVWGCWRPADLRPIFVGWMVLVFPIGWTVSLLALTVLFFGVFTPIGLAFRLAGRDFLRLNKDPAAESYWEPMAVNLDPKSYLNQF